MDDDALGRLLQQFEAVCHEVFGEERVEAAIQLGSSVKGGAIPGYSDIDLHVYLTSDCFDENVQLRYEEVFAFQAAFAELPWHETAFAYPQVHFLDARRLPVGWVGPSGPFRELAGSLPVPPPTDAELRAASLRYVRNELPERTAADLHNFVDATLSSMPHRLRYLGTEVAPAILSLAALDADDASAVWALSKFDALALLEQRYSPAPGPGQARDFYEGVRVLYGERWDDDLARATFRNGIDFLRWVIGVGAGGTH